MTVDRTRVIRRLLMIADDTKRSLAANANDISIIIQSRTTRGRRLLLELRIRGPVYIISTPRHY